MYQYVILADTRIISQDFNQYDKDTAISKMIELMQQYIQFKDGCNSSLIMIPLRRTSNTHELWNYE